MLNILALLVYNVASYSFTLILFLKRYPKHAENPVLRLYGQYLKRLQTSIHQISFQLSLKFWSDVSFELYKFTQ